MVTGRSTTVGKGILLKMVLRVQDLLCRKNGVSILKKVKIFLVPVYMQKKLEVQLKCKGKTIFYNVCAPVDNPVKDYRPPSL